MRSLCLVASVTAVLAFGCTVEETKNEQQTAAITASPSSAVVHPMHAEPELGLRFPMATKGITFKMWHFDPNLPPEKFRHEIQLSGAQGVQVVIDVWDNPTHLDVQAWADQRLNGLFNDKTKRTNRPMSHARAPGILFEQPATEQGGDEQAFAAFTTRDRAYLFYCPYVLEDSQARGTFDEIVDQFETEVSP